MPSYDSSRARFRLADRHIAVLSHLTDGETPPDELRDALVELQRTALVGEEGELSPRLRPLIATLADPVVMIQVETGGGGGTVGHGVVIGQDHALAYDGWPGEEESEYVRVEPSMLVWEVARKVNLRRADPAVPAGAHRIRTTVAALDAAFLALAETADPDGGTAFRRARDAVAETDPALPGAERDQLVGLAESLDATWRVTSVWDGDHGGERSAMVRCLAVWDCGPRGYWIRDEPAEPISPGGVAPDSALVLTAARPGEVWDRLAGLLPDRADLFVQPSP